MLIETDRLLIRKAQLGDAVFFHSLMNSKPWLVYIGDRNIKSVSNATDYIQNNLINNYKKLGYGLYVVCLKKDDTCVGISGFLKRDYLDFPDLGFAFLPEYMRQGYGYESSVALLDYGFKKFQFDVVQAITISQNKTSCDLLTKLGMKHVSTIQPHQDVLLVYQKTKQDGAKA
jgi:[ribosomal protein S5]-alanine N-acetyltransferase